MPPLNESQWDDVVDDMERSYPFLAFPGLIGNSRRRVDAPHLSTIPFGVQSIPGRNTGIPGHSSISIAMAGSFHTSSFADYKSLGFHTYYAPEKLLRIKILPSRPDETNGQSQLRWRVVWRMYAVSHAAYGPNMRPDDTLIREAIYQEKCRRAQWDQIIDEMERSTEAPVYPGLYDFSNPEKFSGLRSHAEIHIGHSKIYAPGGNKGDGKYFFLCGMMSSSADHEIGVHQMYRRNRVIRVKVEQHPVEVDVRLLSWINYQIMDHQPNLMPAIKRDVHAAIEEEYLSKIAQSINRDLSHEAELTASIVGMELLGIADNNPYIGSS